MDRSLPGSSVHGIFQARVLEWGAIPFSESRSLVVYKNELSVLYRVVCIYQSLSSNLSLPTPYLLVTISLFSTSVTLFAFCRCLFLPFLRSLPCFLKKYLFVLFYCFGCARSSLRHVWASSSLTRGGTQPPCIGSVES